jgi:hypothetical protein
MAISQTGDRNRWAAVTRAIRKAWFNEDVTGVEQPPNTLYNEAVKSVNSGTTGYDDLIKAGASSAAVADTVLLPNGAEIPTGKTLNIVDAAGFTYAAGVTIAPGTVGGVVTIGNAAGTGDIIVGSSSAAESVKIANGAGAPTVNVANVSTAGATVTVAGAATAGTAADTVNIATGNAAATAKKIVNIATGVPNTTGNNEVIIGGGAKSSVTTNAVQTSYQAVNFFTTAGSANALTGTLNDAAGNAVTVAAGLRVTIKCSAGLQAGANTFNLNSHGNDAVKLSSNPANNIGTAYVTNSIVDMIFDGTVWQVLAQ